MTAIYKNILIKKKALGIKIHYITKPIKFGAKNYLTQPRKDYLNSLGLTDPIDQSIIQYAFNSLIQFQNKPEDEQQEIIEEYKKPYYFNYEKFKYDYGIIGLSKRLESISNILGVELIEYENHKSSRTMELDDLLQTLKEIKITKKDYNIQTNIKSEDVVVLRQNEDQCPEVMGQWLEYINEQCSLFDYGYQIEKLKELEGIDEDRKMLWINGFLMKPQFFCSNNSTRFYDDFAQTIPSKIKKEIFPESENYFDIDIKASHLSIMFSLSPKLNKFNASNYRDEIIKETGLDKSIIKAVLNAKLFGSGDKKVLLKKYCTESQLNIINSNKKYQTVISEIKYIKENIMDKMIEELEVVLPVMDKKLPQHKIIGSKFSALCCHIERTSLLSTELMKLMINNKDLRDNIHIVLDMHDGILFKATSKEAFNKYYPIIKRVIDKKFKDNKIKTEIECK